MKIEKVFKNRNKLIKLKLIQTKTYIKKQYITNIKLEDIEYRLKKIFHIIYKYHTCNKKILFIGTPFNFNSHISRVFKAMNHIFIPHSVWIKGALSNKKLCFKHLLEHEKTSKNKMAELLLKLKRNIDLVVVLDELNNEDILNEGYISRIPIILINSNLNIIFNKPSYKVPGNFHFALQKIRDNLFYSMLVSTFKKGDKYKYLFNKYAATIKPPKFKRFNKFYKNHGNSSYNKSFTKLKFNTSRTTSNTND
jgi:ribosomal protein S2